MLVSIIIPSFKIDSYSDLVDAIDSLLKQSYVDIEVVVVIHTNKSLYDEVVKAYRRQTKVKVVFNEQSLGAYAARNVGIKAAQGEILAFLDDDAVADEKWIENLVNTYRELDAMAVGGKILPTWLPCKPAYFPEELYWLVGVTHKGFAEDKR
jgi:Predicted glycosyltransferases